MRLTERQRKVLSMLRILSIRDERGFHLTARISQHFSVEEKNTFSFNQGWSNELHKEIETLVNEGYVIRNNVHPLLIDVRKPELLFGIWFHGSFAGQFEMHILGKRKESSLEKIGGEIVDGFGLAHFWGEREGGKIRFTKLYDAGSHPGAAKSEILYQGEKDKGGLYRGIWNFMYKGEIPYSGEFVLARRIKYLPFLG